jgi:hypothetical protein
MVGGSGGARPSRGASGGEQGGRARSRATVEGGGVGATRDGTVDSWAEMRWGLVFSGWVRGEAMRREESARH